MEHQDYNASKKCELKFFLDMPTPVTVVATSQIGGGTFSWTDLLSRCG